MLGRLDRAREARRRIRRDDTDYRKDPLPPLPPEEAAWAEELLRKKGLR